MVASLAANRAARWRPGQARREAAWSCARAEEALSAGGVGAQRRLDPLDLDQVDPESRSRGTAVTA